MKRTCCTEAVPRRREGPILMCGEMARATLEGRKTETRRVIDLDVAANLEDGLASELQTVPDQFGEQVPVIPFCPHGQVGDRLWVREGWKECGNCGHANYRATVNKPCNCSACDAFLEGPWKPSIFMPKFAARIWLEIVGVRVERVQEITEEEALAEGVRLPVTKDGHWAMRITGKYPPCNYRTFGNPALAEYASLWDTLNEKRGFGWDKNPWVWVEKFRRVTACCAQGAARRQGKGNG